MRSPVSRAFPLWIAAALPAACCSTTTATGPRYHRDTPEDAFVFLREAFREERVGDQLRAMHPDFLDRNGITSFKYEMAWTLAPGEFRAVAAALGGARVASVERGAGLRETRRGPRRWVRIRIESPEGAGVFVLVDEPGFLARTSDPDVPENTGRVPAMDAAARIEGGTLVVETRIPLGDSGPADGAEVRRVEFHRDWLLFDIESLSGFEALLDRVRTAAEETRRDADASESDAGDGGQGGER